MEITLKFNHKRKENIEAFDKFTALLKRSGAHIVAVGEIQRAIARTGKQIDWTDFRVQF